jgi:hypothetical protein
MNETKLPENPPTCSTLNKHTRQQRGWGGGDLIQLVCATGACNTLHTHGRGVRQAGRRKKGLGRRQGQRERERGEGEAVVFLNDLGKEAEHH